MLKKIPVGPDAYELVDDFGGKVVNLTSITDGDGTLRVTATVTGNLASDIIDGLRLLEVLRASVATPAGAYPAPPMPPVQAARSVPH